jgi:LysR family hydrogen peroxide-inducible transcriptional activator
MKALPSLRHLRYLVALEQHRHFAHAASACGVSQSTLSAGIRELEGVLGVSVAERDRRHVHITPIGRRVAEMARVVLEDAERLVDLCTSSAAPMSGELNLGSIPTIGPFLLPKLLPHLKQCFPALDIHLREDKSKALLQQLAEHRLDLLLLAFPYDAPDCETMMLFRDAYRFACKPDDPLARSDAISSRDLAKRRLMLLEPEHCLHSHALPVLESAAERRTTTFSGTSLPTLVAMVSVGIGNTLLPELAIDGGVLQASDVVTRPLSYRAGAREIGLCWRQDDPRCDDFRRIGKAIQQWAATHRPHADGRPSPRADRRAAGPRNS